MRFPEVCSSLSSLALAAFMVSLILPRASLNKQKSGRSSEVDKMNRTLRDKVNTNRFLDKIINAIKQSNGSQPPYVKRLPNDTGVMTRDNSNVIAVPIPSLVRNVSSKEVKSPTPAMHSPNVIYSESPAKNVLTFRFRPETIVAGKAVTRINLFLYVTKKDNNNNKETSPYPKSRNLPNVKNTKGKKIKILIYLINAAGTRIQKVAELKKSVSNSQWEKLGLPVSLIRTVAEAETNNTLYLKVECKKCNKKTQLNLPGKCARRHRVHKSKKEKREQLWKNNCSQTGSGSTDTLKPFIVVETNPHASGRSRRTAGSGDDSCNDDISGDANWAVGAPAPVCCRPVKTFVELSDLNLDDVIVSPSGFDVVTCSGACTDTSPLGQRLHARRMEGSSVHFSSSLSKESRRILRSLYQDHHDHHRHQQHHQHSPDHQVKRRQQFKNHHWYNKKWTKPKSSSSCVPTQTKDLILLHFSHDQTLVQSVIPNFLVTKCGCNNRR